MTSNLGICTAVSAYSEWNGSAIPPDCWDEYPRLINRGVSQATYILWPENPDELRDIERLANDAGDEGTGFDELTLRLATPFGERPATPRNFIAQHRAKLLGVRAQSRFKNRRAYLHSEPNLELAIRDADGNVTGWLMTPEEFLAWYKETLVLFRAEFPDFEVISPPVAGYDGQAWYWWDKALRECCALSDLAGVNLYPSTVAELDLGKVSGKDDLAGWSLPWWQGQVGGKKIWVCELGCRTGTPAATRDALLPMLWRQMRDCPDVVGSGWFVQWSKGQEHRQHWWTVEQKDELLAVIAEAPGTAPTTPTTPTPGDTTPPFPPALPVGGKAVYRITVERVE
ncbi:MAG: hypothetical protein M1531_09510 [Chloroflexi bacterium]|nr:hypothetical protein [Chloroflexota bacterium]